MLYDYICNDCKWSFEAINSVANRHNQGCVKCGSRNVVKLIGSLVPYGTRDSFGIGKEFQDPESGKVIDNWKSWERAGYRNPLEVTKDLNIRSGIKRKINKFQHEKGKRIVI